MTEYYDFLYHVFIQPETNLINFLPPLGIKAIDILAEANYLCSTSGVAKLLHIKYIHFADINAKYILCKHKCQILQQGWIEGRSIVMDVLLDDMSHFYFFPLFAGRLVMET